MKQLYLLIIELNTIANTLDQLSDYADDSPRLRESLHEVANGLELKAKELHNLASKEGDIRSGGLTF